MATKKKDMAKDLEVATVPVEEDDALEDVDDLEVIARGHHGDPRVPWMVVARGVCRPSIWNSASRRSTRA
jgi:hypothetical protein